MNKHSIKSISLLIFVFLFSILPEFTLILDRPVYEWVVVAEIFVLLFCNRGRAKYFKQLKYIIIGILLYTIMYGVHGEWGSILTVLIDCFIVIYIIISEIDSYEKIEKSIYALLVGGLFLSIEGIFEYIFESNWFSVLQTIDPNINMGAFSLGYRYNHVRIEGSFGQCLPFAMYLLFINFLCIYLFVQGKRNKKKPHAVCYITYVITFISIFLTTGRLVLVLLVVLQCYFALNMNPAKKTLIIFLAFVAIVVIALTSSDTLLDPLYTLLSVFNPNYYQKVSDGGQNVSYRLQLFSALSSYIRSNPLFGIGYTQKSGLRFNVVTPTSSWMAYSIDNNYLSYLVTYGIVGVISTCFVLLWAIVLSFKNRKVEKFGFKWFLFILILYALDLFNVFQMGEKRIFFIIVGFVIALDRIYKKELREDMK